MSKGLNIAVGAVALASSSVAFAASISVDSTAILDPNPSNLGITEVGNTGLTAARAAITAGRVPTNTGLIRAGVVDFQQQAQGGTFPNSTAADNGIDFANGATQPLLVTAGSVAGTGGLVATGPTIFSFYRLESTGDAAGANAAAINGTSNFDSNLNQGINTISGGFSTRYPGAVTASNPTGDGTAVTGSNPNLLPTVTIGGAYIGIVNTASPATLVFNTPLSFFGITALPRGATRDTLLTLTLSDGSTVAVGGGAQVVGTSAVFFGYTAATGLTITSAALTNPNGQGQNRYDDLAFIVAPTTTVPEPATLGLLGVGALGLVRRQRRA